MGLGCGAIRAGGVVSCLVAVYVEESSRAVNIKNSENIQKLIAQDYALQEKIRKLDERKEKLTKKLVALREKIGL